MLSRQIRSSCKFPCNLLTRFIFGVGFFMVNKLACTNIFILCLYNFCSNIQYINFLGNFTHCKCAVGQIQSNDSFKKDILFTVIFRPLSSCVVCVFRLCSLKYFAYFNKHYFLFYFSPIGQGVINVLGVKEKPEQKRNEETDEHSKIVVVKQKERYKLL